MDSRGIEPTFVMQLHTALKYLYDPAELRSSPLTVLLDPVRHSDPAAHLRKILVQSIEAVKPDEGVPRHSPLWRDYQILYGRYTEQFLQQEVAADLGLSIRQLRRQEKSAVEALANYLWLEYGLVENKKNGAEGDNTDEGAARSVPTMKEELAWLHESASQESGSVDHLIQAAINTAGPLCRSHCSKIRYERSDLSQALVSSPTIMQQALLNILTMAIGMGPGATIDVTVESEQSAVAVCVYPLMAGDADGDDAIRMARQLTESCDGKLDIRRLQPDHDKGSIARLILPTVPQTHVLVIDDNPDTLQLFHRYSSGTSYRVTGMQDAQAAVSRAHCAYNR